MLLWRVTLVRAELTLSAIADFALSTLLACWRCLASADVVPRLITFDLLVSMMLEELAEDAVGQVKAAPAAVHTEIVIMVEIRTVHQRTATA